MLPGLDVNPSFAGTRRVDRSNGSAPSTGGWDDGVEAEAARPLAPSDLFAGTEPDEHAPTNPARPLVQTD